ncbi:hypothetical protein [Chromohalobacter canadensis]|uniref:hypothetical protein n=1 Tax=Chromohalobacter canadensis TaxID=141389 RepID=UPI003CCB8CF4
MPGIESKQPHLLCREDRELIWLAIIWSERSDGTPGCAILTEPCRGQGDPPAHAAGPGCR